MQGDTERKYILFWNMAPLYVHIIFIFYVLFGFWTHHL